MIDAAASQSAIGPYGDERALVRSARRITSTLFVLQSLGSAGTIAVATVGSILGAELGGRTALAGVPGAVSQLGSAGTALGLSLLADRIGRRAGFSVGLALGVLGAVAAIVGVALTDFVLLLVGMLVMSAGRSAALLGRFAAAEVNPPARRGRAVAMVVLGGTVGSVLGPSLIAPSSRLAVAMRLPELAGPFIVPLALGVVSTIVAFWLLRPDPQQLGREIELRYPSPVMSFGAARPWGVLLRDPGVMTAMSAMVFSQAVMVGLMGITSLHMLMHAHGLGAISLVFSAHTLGMYAPSIASGWLADRFGRRPVIVAGAFLLLLSCIVSPLSTATPPLVFGLFLLGLGWNLCYVAGSALLSDRLTLAEKGRAQGVNELLMGVVSAGVTLGVGFLFAAAGYTMVGVAAGVITVTLLIVLAWYSSSRHQSEWLPKEA